MIFLNREKCFEPMDLRRLNREVNKNVVPVWVTAKRARDMLNRRKLGSFIYDYYLPDGMTIQEETFFHKVWNEMSGSSSFYYAVCEVANGRVQIAGEER